MPMYSDPAKCLSVLNMKLCGRWQNVVVSYCHSTNTQRSKTNAHIDNECHLPWQAQICILHEPNIDHNDIASSGSN